ncbi:MAG: hypothetical protein KJ674_01670 [Nanoarchaeota archaeon]|nr:hypothetical protein [Nanoarchaeota archaeon]
MGKLVKSKAVFQILVLVLAIFTISLMNSEEVKAENKVCCEKTKGSSPYGGGYCEYTESTNCDVSEKSPGFSYQTSNLACEQTTYCEPVCCIDDGLCETNILKAVCLENNGAFNEDASCAVDQCQKGCCGLPDGASFSTQVECGNMIEPYGDLVLDEVFDASITDEYSCLLSSLSSEEGCCVGSSSCTFGTRAECNQGEGEFNLDTLCSYQALGCQVTEKHHVGCLEGDDEVYWFDSAGNVENIYGAIYEINGKRVPKEDVLAQSNCDLIGNVEDVDCGACDYIKGSICGEASDDFLNAVENANLDPNKINYMCQDLNCYDLYDGGVANARWDDELHGDGYRYNGESWCEYEGDVGAGKDLVGSRHYRRYCMNGKEYVEPCDEKRESICVQNIIPEEISGIDGGISGAICRENLWLGCFADENGDHIDTADKCEALGKDCFWDSSVTFGGNTDGICAPMVPVGGLEEDEGACFESMNFKEQWVKKNVLDDWDCEENCWINENGPEFADNMWGLCKSLGDCGAYYNVVGEVGYDSRSSYRVVKTSGSHGRGTWPYDFPPSFSDLDLADAEEYINGNLFWSFFVAGYAGAISTSTCNDVGCTHTVLANYLNWAENSGFAWIMGTYVTTMFLLNTILFTTVMVPLGYTAVGGFVLGALNAPVGFLTAVLGPVGVILLGIVLLATLILVIIGGDDEEINFKFVCEHWNPPIGGEDCERCDDFTKCDEYKCQSLGAACEFVNSNGEEACVWMNRGDTNYPLITPLPIAPKEIDDFTLVPPDSGIDGGYIFDDVIPAYTSVKVGIKTDERAQCKISKLLAKPYDDMTNYFDTGFLYNHTMTIPVVYDDLTEDQIGISGGGEYVFYIKCIDVNGNKNLKDYFIKFIVDDAPDTTAPIIEDFSIQNNAYLPHNMNTTELVVYLNEPANPQNGGCKYSRVDKDYNLMEYNMTCLTSQIQGDYYGCVEPSLDIIPNTENVFYFRCQDTNGNINTQSYQYILKSSDSLNLVNVGPEGEVHTTQVEITATTEKGAENGKAKCYYSLNNYFDPNGLLFTNTDSTTHSTELFLQNENDYTFYLWCRDIAGNEDTKTITFHTTTNDLNITNVLPQNNSKFYANNIYLDITTIGGYNENGESDCYYNGNNINDDVEIGDTQTTHEENVTGLSSGEYNYEIKCTDQYKTDIKHLYFEIDLESVPELQQVYTTYNLLNVMMSTPSECKYTTTGNFEYVDGTLMPSVDEYHHQAYLGNNDVFYIKCKDINTELISELYTIYI